MYQGKSLDLSDTLLNSQYLEKLVCQVLVLQSMYLCCIPGSGDPHLLIQVPGVELPVCFDYKGKDQDVITMIADEGGFFYSLCRLKS